MEGKLLSPEDVMWGVAEAEVRALKQKLYEIAGMAGEMGNTDKHNQALGHIATLEFMEKLYELEMPKPS
jgi:hypothetical protein